MDEFFINSLTLQDLLELDWEEGEGLWEESDRTLDKEDVDTIFSCSAPPNLANPEQYERFWVNTTNHEYYGLKGSQILLIPRSAWMLPVEYQRWMVERWNKNSD